MGKFIVPAALSQLTFLILNLADAFFVGHTNDNFQIASISQPIKENITALILLAIYVVIIKKEL